MNKEYNTLTEIFNVQDKNEYINLKHKYLEGIAFYNKNYYPIKIKKAQNN